MSNNNTSQEEPGNRSNVKPEDQLNPVIASNRSKWDDLEHDQKVESLLNRISSKDKKRLDKIQPIPEIKFKIGGDHRYEVAVLKHVLQSYGKILTLFQKYILRIEGC